MKIGDKIFINNLSGVYNQSFIGKTGKIIKIISDDKIYVKIDDCEIEEPKEICQHWFYFDEFVVIPENISRLKLEFLKLLYGKRD